MNELISGCANKSEPVRKFKCRRIQKQKAVDSPLLLGIFFVNTTHVAADGISFAATFLQKSPLAHSVAAPLRIEPAAPGFDSVFSSQVWASFLSIFPTPEQSSLCSGVFFAAGIKDAVRPLPCSSFPTATRCAGLAVGFLSRLAASFTSPAMTFIHSEKVWPHSFCCSSFSKPSPLCRASILLLF